MTAMRPSSPTAAEIRAARHGANLSQTAAAELCYSTLRTWQNWEGGGCDMHPAIWRWWLLQIADSACVIMPIA